MDGNGNIAIPLEEYKKLLEVSVRVKAFEDFVKKNEFSINREECAMFLGFKLKNEED